MLIDMETIGYFLFMSEEERKAKEAQENRSTDDNSISAEEEPAQKNKGDKYFLNPETTPALLDRAI